MKNVLSACFNWFTGSLFLWICLSTVIVTGCAHTKPLAQVEEIRQRSVTDDPNVQGDFPNDWLIADAGAHLPQTPPAASEIPEFLERFQHTRTPGLVNANLPPGDTQTVSLPVSGPSGLAGSVRWIGTINPLTVTIALDGVPLATGTAYHIGHDRGGSYVRTQTTAAGLATIAVTNSSGEPVKVSFVFMATTL